MIAAENIHSPRSVRLLFGWYFEWWPLVDNGPRLRWVLRLRCWLWVTTRSVAAALGNMQLASDYSLFGFLPLHYQQFCHTRTHAHIHTYIHTYMRCFSWWRLARLCWIPDWGLIRGAGPVHECRARWDHTLPSKILHVHHMYAVHSWKWDINALNDFLLIIAFVFASSWLWPLPATLFFFSL